MTTGFQPLVSILMNCYNGEKYLCEAIESVLAQTYQNWEIVFWDNVSTDRSAEIFKSYEDPRLKYRLAPTHTWLYEARSYAIAHADGELLAFLDVDDWWLPEKLEKQVALFDDEAVGFASGDCWIQSERKGKKWLAVGHPAPSGWVLDEILKSHFIMLVTLIIRRTALDSLGKAADPRYHILGDYDLEVRLAINWKLGFVQAPIAYYRLHDANETAKHRNRQVGEMETWLGELAQIEAVRSSPGFHSLEEHLTYLKAMTSILEGKKRDAFRLTHSLKWGSSKARLWIGILAPGFVVRWLKN